MKFDELEAALRKRPEEAPSDLELDRLVRGGLDPEEAAAVEARANAHPHTAARLSELRKGMDAFEDVDARAQLAAIRRRLGSDDGSVLKRFLRGFFWLAPMAAVGVVALVVIPRLQPPVEPDADHGGGAVDVVRLKGGIKLEVVRKRGDKAEKTVSGSLFHAGDVLRFVISLPSDGEVSIVGVERDGSLYVAWPLASQKLSTYRPAGDAQALPGAVELDDTAGQEVLHLVHCPRGVTPTCHSGGSGKPPSCPDGCVTTPFVVRKE